VDFEKSHNGGHINRSEAKALRRATHRVGLKMRKGIGVIIIIICLYSPMWALASPFGVS
jgi:hypothetical protein